MNNLLACLLAIGISGPEHELKAKTLQYDFVVLQHVYYKKSLSFSQFVFLDFDFKLNNYKCYQCRIVKNNFTIITEKDNSKILYFYENYSGTKTYRKVKFSYFLEFSGDHDLEFQLKERSFNKFFTYDKNKLMRPVYILRMGEDIFQNFERITNPQHNNDIITITKNSLINKFSIYKKDFFNCLNVVLPENFSKIGINLEKFL